MRESLQRKLRQLKRKRLKINMEEWREIPNWPAYDISSLGRIKVRRAKNGRTKSLSYTDVQTYPGKKGERYVNLYGLCNGNQQEILNHPVSELHDLAFGLKSDVIEKPLNKKLEPKLLGKIKSWLFENGIVASNSNIRKLVFDYNNFELSIGHRMQLIVNTKDPMFLKYVQDVGINKELYTPQGKPRKVNTIKHVKCNKAVFKAKKEAEFKINFLNNMGIGKKKDKSGLRAYPCGKCKGWHLTSKPLSGRKY